MRAAIADLTDLASNKHYDFVYTMRSMKLFVDFLEVHIDRLSSDCKQRLTKLLDVLQEKSREADHFPRAEKGESRVLKKALADARLILFNS